MTGDRLWSSRHSEEGPAVANQNSGTALRTAFQRAASASSALDGCALATGGAVLSLKNESNSRMTHSEP
jgi:hypothetical protein